MVYYSLVFILVGPANAFISSVNIVVIAKIWEHCTVTKNRSKGATNTSR